LPNHCSPCKRVAARKHEGDIDIIVTCFWHWQFYIDAKGRGVDIIVRITGEPISEPIASERASALHPFVIPTGIVNIIEVVVLRGGGDVEIREIIRSCLWAKFVQNV